MLERHFSLILTTIVPTIFCATMANAQDATMANAQDMIKTVEIAFFGAEPSHSTQAAISAVANQMAYQAEITRNNLDIVRTSSPDHPLWVAVSGQNVDDTTLKLVSILNETDRKARTTIFVEDRVKNLDWLNSLNVGENVGIVITTPKDDLDYMNHLIKPIEEEFGKAISLEYHYSTAVAETLGQLLESKSGMVASNPIGEWQAGFVRAGFESGLITLPSAMAESDGVTLHGLLADKYGTPTHAHEMFSGAELFKESDTFDTLLANIAMAKNCCNKDGGKDGCRWNKVVALYQFQNIGKVRLMEALGGLMEALGD